MTQFNHQAEPRTLSISTSPHVKSGASVDTIMRHVVYALLPVCAYAIYLFGLSALACILTATLSCVLTEFWFTRNNRAGSTVSDWSAVITGILLGLTLPPNLPLWMVASGGIVAIGLGKTLFGGLGFNAFNPALVGRAFLQAAFPVAMTSWVPAVTEARFSTLFSSQLAFPFTAPEYDGLSSATPLAKMKFEQLSTEHLDLMLGMTSGSTGETGAILILLGGLYLALRKMLDWRIPVVILATVAVLSSIFYLVDAERYPDPVFMLCSGGLMLGAIFMATDMVASPNTLPGVLIYGFLIGGLVVAIRLWGGMPEGVMYAILLANAVAPHLDPWFQPRVFGTQRDAPDGKDTAQKTSQAQPESKEQLESKESSAEPIKVLSPEEAKSHG